MATVAPAAPAPKAAAPMLLDVCGVGMVPLALPPGGDPNAAPETSAAAGPGSALPPHLGVHPYAQARGQLMAALHAGTPRQQAAAWMLDEEPAAVAQLPAALAALARTSQDTAIWRWAIARCRAAGGGCAGLRAADWARADGSNAMPWMQLLQDDPAAAAEAWRGLAQASRLQSTHGLLAATVLQAWPADAPVYLAMVAVVDALGLESALTWPALAPVAKGCTQPTDGVPDAAQCNAVIGMLLSGSDNVLTFGFGYRMARRAGWPADQLAALQAEQDKLNAAGGWPLSNQLFSCDAVRAMQTYVTRMGQVGELGAMRQNAAERAAALAAAAAAASSAQRARP